MRRLVPLSILALWLLPAFAVQMREPGGRFEHLAIADPSHGLDVATTPLASLPAGDGIRAGWEGFLAAQGRDWSVWLDRRSGAPLLVQGKGIPWPLVHPADAAALETSVRQFIGANRALLLADGGELVFDHDASGELADDVWQVVFDRAVAGVPVDGERYTFTIGHGHLVSFGTPRWSKIDVPVAPDVDAAGATSRLAAYMKLGPAEGVEAEPSRLTIIPLRSAPRAPGGGKYAGPVGAGYSSALVWRVVLRVAGDPGTWVGLVDAHDGSIRSLVDDTKYARVKGGVYPNSDDQNCPAGCEQPAVSMPFANIVINGSGQTANTLGIFSCSPSGAAAVTTLAGQYVRVNDQCGAISQSINCSADVDLQTSAGTDCDVPPGASAGNTHSARSSFYHLNRIAEHARTWLPTRTWLTQQLNDNVNIDASCNAYWDGSAVNFFKSSGSCRNTGELAGVFLHEWGHGLDQNDGGGFDNPSEAYADITSLMMTHVSCIGPGFFKGGNCGGYGNACLACTGVRDQDWDMRANHQPSTPAGFGATYCPVTGDGPCGFEAHCEGYISGEAMWDLATRDLPAMGLDPGSAWQLADKLWFKSRLGSSGNAYNCALPDSDGCSSDSWFTKLRTADDDDGNFANGTPHAAAIFAAFDRHGIACGQAGDASNQNSTTCPVLGAPVLSGTAASAAALLSWTPVSGSIGYRILRNDSGCDTGTTRLSVLTGTTFTDSGLINAYPLYYNVQAMASNIACDGPISNCLPVTPQSAAGTIKLDASTYACSGQVGVTVIDSNVGSNTTTVNFTSTTETTAEPITVTRVTPGSATYVGTITLTSAAPSHDGLLSVKDGDTITAKYIDANDGAGHVNLPRTTTAAVSCPPPPSAKPVADGTFGTEMTASRVDPAGGSISVTWDVATCVSPDHHLLYGDLADVATTTVLGAACDLGVTGNATWSAVPPEDIWFVIVGDDHVATEGSWGTDATSGQRGGTTVSGQCGMTTRDNSGTCP
jgi:hypothetical protein